MKTKLNNQINDLNKAILKLYDQQDRDNSSKFKILPYLRSANHQCQPIDYHNYQRLRKYRRDQLMQSEHKSSLFLEGEVAYSAPRQKLLKRSKEGKKGQWLISKKWVNQQRLSKLFKEGQLSQMKIKQKKDLSGQLDGNIKHIREQRAKSYMQKPNTLTLTTIQSSIVSGHSRKKTKHRHIQKGLRQEGNIKKPLLYLDQKQLQQIKAESFIVMQYPSRQIVSAHKHKCAGQIASLTKIMTFYTVYQIAAERNVSLSKEVVVDEEASEMSGTTASLLPGDRMSVEQLLYGLMLPSGNDAAVCLAKWAGSLIASSSSVTSPLSTFVYRMNKFAKLLQLRCTSFGNPHGLPNNRNISNPYDLSILIAECLKISLFCRIVSTQTYKLSVQTDGLGGKRQVLWQNTNKLLGRKGFIGVKTGVTVTAGPCLASCYQAGKKKYIVVLLRTNKLSRRFKQTRMILGWSLRRLSIEYERASNQMLERQSDNSEDEQEFRYAKVDALQLARRNDILVYEL